MNELLFFLSGVALVALIFAVGVALSRRTRQDQDVTGSMGKGHAPAYYKPPPPRPSQLEIFHREYVKRGWMGPTAEDRAEDERRLDVYREYLDGK